jgi:hypothetical protein
MLGPKSRDTRFFWGGAVRVAISVDEYVYPDRQRTLAQIAGQRIATRIEGIASPLVW